MSKPIDQERELFEKHLLACNEGWQPEHFVFADGEYENRFVNDYFGIWQARAAVQPAGVAVPDEIPRVIRYDDSVPNGYRPPAAPRPVSGEQKAPAIDYQRKFECLVEHAKRQDKVIAEMRYDENIRRFYDDGAVWFWAGDGTDNLETLACPVVINAGDLRALIAPAAQDVAGLVEALETAHRFIESTEAFGLAAASGILQCGDVQWDVEASKALIAAHRAQQGEKP